MDIWTVGFARDDFDLSRPNVTDGNAMRSADYISDRTLYDQNDPELRIF
jgi:hypothetical protein